MIKFEKNFIFGLAASSYQIEGAATEDGRSPSIWDTFCKTPGKVYKGHTGDVACDHYHRYKEDVKILKEIGVNAYRFSISWSRIFPEYGKYNPKGMEFYKKLVDELNRNDIEPTVTLFHWDLPMWAYNMGGWLNRDSVKWFQEYAVKIFEDLNDSVKFWTTHNEPFCASILGYYLGIHAPGHKNEREALIAAHHLLLSPDSKLNYQSVEGNLKKTAMGWEIYPEGLYDIIVRLRKEYTRLPVYITENGAAFNDVLSEKKRVNDVERIDYIKSHLMKIAELNQQGADIRGYYLWSLMDNFEWAYGYSKRFGTVYVDFKTQERILKDSALWYKDVIKNRSIK